MSTLTPDRLEEVAATWRRGLDAGDLTNPAGPRLGDDEFTAYEITMTGSTPQPVTACTMLSMSFDPSQGLCFCCHQP
jgi:hypothetical protein